MHPATVGRRRLLAPGRTARAATACACVLIFSALASAQSVIHVDASARGDDDGTSWTDAFVHLADALAVAAAGDQVWVAEGTYRPDGTSSPLHPDPPVRGDRDATFTLVSGVALYGGFDGTETSLAQRAGLFDTTVLSGDLAGDDGPEFAGTGENTHHVLTATGVDATAVVDGFRVVAGNAASPSWGAGLLNTGSTGPTLRRCTFVGHQGGGAPGIGGGGAVHNASSSPTFEHCSFLENTAGVGGAIYNVDDSDPRLIDCFFEDNEATIAGAVYNFNGSDAWFERCTFQRNTAERFGAVFNGGSDPVFIDCSFRLNRAFDPQGSGDGGAMGNSGASPLVVGCAFIGNTADGETPFPLELDSGGAVFNSHGVQAVFVNCVFAGNLAEAGGAMINESDAAPTLIHCTVFGNSNTGIGSLGSVANYTLLGCVLWGNTGAGATTQDNQVFSPTLTVHDSCVEGWDGSLGGTGNIGADPLFVDASVMGDLRLSPGSPCIDAGHDASLPGDAADIDCDGDTAEPVPLDKDGLLRRHDDPATPDTGAGLAPRPDMGAHEFGAGLPVERWTDLGFALGGTHGDPLLEGGGTLCAAQAVSLELGGALESTAALLCLAPAPLHAPLKGGTLVPDVLSPPGNVLLLATDGAGALGLSAAWPGNIPSGVDLYFQVWVVDAGGPSGYAASNALQATTP